MKRTLVLVVMILITTACGGGSGSSPTEPSNSGNGSGSGGSGGGSSPTGTMSARIDGVQWTAASAQGTINNGVVSIVGITAGQVFSIGVTVNRGPATYTAGIIDPFNVVVSNLTIGSSGWDAGPVSGSGSVTIATLTSTTASGTFSLTLAPTPGTGATGNKVTTNGTFNVTLTAQTPLPPAPGNVNGTITALVDGVAWRGAFVARATNSSGILSLTGTDSDSRGIAIVVVANGPGTYSLNCCGNPNNANMTLGGQQWFTAVAGGTGSVTIASLTSTRVTGTFTMTMQPSQANTPPIRVAQVTNGQFDLTF
ncbi:MAG TPA: DUF6252 family protein [Gemmataceae bacterium]|nr:DUF6252 family protein [Gemmataceae bacterium]